MTVYVHKGQLDYFRKKCRATPNEIMAVLFGFHRPKLDHASVEHFEYPELATSTPSETSISADEVDRMKEMAEDLDMSVLGTLHSHPSCLPVLSHTDYSLFTHHNDLLVGICEVPKQGRTRVLFWRNGSPLPCDLTYAPRDSKPKAT